MRTLVFNLATIVAVPLLFWHLYGKPTNPDEMLGIAYYGVWYSIVFSELLATIMTVIFFKVKRKKYQY